VRLTVPAVGIDAPLRAVGTDASGVLAAPADPAVAGWLATGPVPGGQGPAVLAGHVDDVARPAVFFRLSQLHPADFVGVTRSDGSTVRFVVDRVARYPKRAFPTDEVYRPTPDPQLRLVTCGGRFDAASGSYTDNVVVFAHLTG
jgi:sortase (surface protein transpeptidase)